MNADNNNELKGRSAFLAKYRENNPDAAEDVQDDVLWDDAHKRHSSLEDEYGKMNSANSRLAGLVAQDPKLAAVLSMIAGEKPRSLPYAVGSVYGSDFLDGDLDEFETGYQENLRRLAESRKVQEEAQRNIEKSIKNIEKYASENNLEEAEFESLYQGIMDLADNVLNGKIPLDVVDLVHKGINYDRDVQEAADTGFVEGKNEKISARMKNKSGSSLPDLGNSAGSRGGAKPAPPQKKASFFDDMKEVEM
jgi:hypothetical protein